MQAGKERTEGGGGKNPGSIPDPDCAHRDTRCQNTVISDPYQTNPELTGPCIGMAGNLTEGTDQGVITDRDQLRAEVIYPAGLHNFGIFPDCNTRQPIETVLQSPRPQQYRGEHQNGKR